MELEAAGSSKHQTESSANRQLPVGDVYSLKLPWAFVTPVVDGSVHRQKKKLTFSPVCIYSQASGEGRKPYGE